MTLQNIQHLEGMKVGGENINNMRCADITVPIATCEKNVPKNNSRFSW